VELGKHLQSYHIHGFDHNFCLKESKEKKFCARLGTLFLVPLLGRRNCRGFVVVLVCFSFVFFVFCGFWEFFFVFWGLFVCLFVCLRNIPYGGFNST